MSLITRQNPPIWDVVTVEAIMQSFEIWDVLSKFNHQPKQLRHNSLTYLINYNNVCKTDPATPGLSIT